MLSIIKVCITILAYFQAKTLRQGTKDSQFLYLFVWHNLVSGGHQFTIERPPRNANSMTATIRVNLIIR